MRTSRLALLLVVLVSGSAHAANCSLSGAILPPPVVYARSLALEQAALLAAQQIVPRNAVGDYDPAGRVGVVGIGMSSKRNIDQAIRSQINTNNVVWGWDAAVKWATTSQSGKTANFWDEPTDSTWGEGAGSYFASLAGNGLTAAQVQVAWIMLAETQPSGEDGTVPLAQVQAVVAQAKFWNPQLAVVYLSEHPTTLYSADLNNPVSQQTKLPEPYPWRDSVAFAEWVESQSFAVPVLYLPMWSQGELVNPATGVGIDCADVEWDGIHPSGAGSLKHATSVLQRWAVDPVMAFLHSTNGPPPPPPDPVSVPWSGTLTWDGALCTLAGLSPSGVAVSAPVPGGFCDGL